MFPAYDVSKSQNSNSLEWLQNPSFIGRDQNREVIEVESDQNEQKLSAKAECKKELVLLEESEGDKDDVQIVNEKKVKRRKKKRKKEIKKSPSIVSTQTSTPKTPRPEWELMDTGAYLALFSQQRPASQKEEPLFILDRVPQKENLQFEKPYSKHVPKMGKAVPLDFRVSAAGSEKKRRYWARKKSNRQKLTAASNEMEYSFGAKEPLIKIFKDDKKQEEKMKPPPALDISQEFIRISGSEVQSETGERLIYDPSVQMYRVDNQPPQHEKTEEDSTTDDELKQKLNALNKHLTENSGDIDSWLQYASMQREFRPFGGKASTVSDRGTMERTMAILDKALTKNPKSIELKMARLEVGRDLWDDKRKAEEWKKVEFYHVNQLEMWRKLISFGQTNFGSFTVDSQLSIYDRCLSKLENVLKGQLLTHPPLEGTEDFMVNSLLHRCDFLNTAGHFEKALACLQALLEFNFFPPITEEEIKKDVAKARVLFEPFWDSNSPRVGDPGSLGWVGTMKNSEKRDDVQVDLFMSSLERDYDLREDEILGAFTPSTEPDQDAGLLWTQLETLRDYSHWRPWIGLSSEPEDPHRTVLYEDIHSALLWIGDEKRKLRLVIEILNVLGVQHSSLSLVKFPGTINDTFLRDLFGKDASTLMPVHNWRESLEETINRLLDKVAPLFPQQIYQSYFTMIRMSLISQRLVNDNNLSIKQRSRQFKIALQPIMEREENRNNVLLYSHMVRFLGEIDLKAAAQVVTPIIKQHFSENLNTDKDLELNHLISNWLQTILIQSVNHFDVCKLFRMMNQNTGGTEPTALLKMRRSARRTLEDCLNQVEAHYITTTNPNNDHLFTLQWLGSTVVHLAFFAAYLCWISLEPKTKKWNLSGAEEIFILVGEHLRLLQKSTSTDKSLASTLQRDLERLTEYRFLIRQADMRLNPLASPTEYRESIFDALNEFPGNALLLRLISQACLRGYSTIKLRTRIGELANAHFEESPRLHAALFYTEYCRNSQTKNITPVLNLLERVAGTNDSLWGIYLRLHNHWKLEDVKGLERVFYRAIRSCPGAKQLYMDFIRMQPSKLAMCLDLMTEKGVRVRVPIEELQLLHKAVTERGK